MRPSQLIFMMLLIGVIFFSFGAMVNDFEAQYVDTGISNTTPLNDTYRQGFANATHINETFAPLIEDIESLESDEDSGFLDVVEGLVAIPSVAVHLPGIFFNFLGDIKDSIFTMLQLLGIPAGVVIFISIALTIMVIFMIIEFLRRYPS